MEKWQTQQNSCNLLWYNHKRKMTFLNQAPNLRSRLLPLKSSVWPSLVSYIFWNNASHLISELQEPRLRLEGWELRKRRCCPPCGRWWVFRKVGALPSFRGKKKCSSSFSLSPLNFLKSHTSFLCWKDQGSLLIEEAGTKPCNSVSSPFYQLAFIRDY